MELELKGKTALITGGSRGIGLAMAARFAEAGANVMITSRTAEDLAEAVAGLVRAGAPEERVAWAAAHVGRPDDADVVRRARPWRASAASTSWSTTRGPTPTSAP